ncbi:MAG: thioesterase [Candidatus Methanomethylophilaceae archaeon]|nr:thioesterase [Candidatus Methanomethylophilaceae archaeon]
MIDVGIKGKNTRNVTEDLTASSVGSGTLRVFATPAMIALVEETAYLSIAPHLSEGQSSVGTRLDVSHSSATPVGMDVVCETEVVEVDRRRVVFKVVVSDAAGEIGSGVHERFIVDDVRFMEKAESKLRS